MKIIKIAAVLIITTFVVTLLIIGKPLLIPFFIAVVIWYLINAIYEYKRNFISRIIQGSTANGIAKTITIPLIVVKDNT